MRFVVDRNVLMRRISVLVTGGKNIWCIATQPTAAMFLTEGDTSITLLCYQLDTWALGCNEYAGFISEVIRTFLLYAVG